MHEYVFRPRRRARDFEDRVYTLWVALLRDGRIADRDLVMYRRGGAVHAVVEAVAGGSLAELTGQSASALAQLAADCTSVALRASGDDRERRPAGWRRADALYLTTHMLAIAPPLTRMRDGADIPTYMVPIDDVWRDRMYRWMQTYKHLDAIWIDSGPLRIAAYSQLAEPTSSLARDGRAVCAEVERVTGVPTYYVLMRYYMRVRGEARRRCPGCGGAFASRGRFAFRCDRCRLVSGTGIEASARYAKIGDR